MSGLRGVGKTVLLNEMRGLADDAGWFCVNHPRTLAVDGTARAAAAAVDAGVPHLVHVSAVGAAPPVRPRHR